MDSKQLSKLFKDIPQFENQFECIKKLGRGSFSTVVLVRLKQQPSREFAVKCLVRTTNERRASVEYDILQKLGGTNNVMNLLCSFRKDDRIFFMMDYFPHDRFTTFVCDATVDEIRDYIKNLLIALAHIHKFNIIHRDVKATNFLFNRRLKRYRLIDFGLAEVQQDAENLLDIVFTKTKCKSQDDEDENDCSPPAKKKRLPSPNKLGSVTNFEKKYDTNATLRSVKRVLFDSNTAPEVVHKNKPNVACTCHGSLDLCKICKGRPHQKTNKAGTAGFRAPEVLLNHPLQTTAVDVWSAGVILLGLTSRRYPFLKPKDDSTAFAQLITIFGSDKFIAFAKTCGKLLICQPFFPKLKLQMLCEVLRCSKAQLTPLTNVKRCHVCCRSFSTFGCFVCLCKFRAGSSNILNVLPSSLYDLLEKLLTVEPDSRISASHALEHNFFA